MKRAMVLAIAILLCLPSFSHAVFVTLFPDNSGMDIATSGEVNGVTHLLLQADLNTFNLHGVAMISNGTPDFANTGGRPWLFGQLANIVQVGPSTFTITWNLFTSVGGAAPFVFGGTLSITVTAPTS
jgi:hypothetical protein